MTLNQIKAANKDFGANHTIKVSGFKDGNGGPKKPRNTKPPKYFVEFQDMTLKFIKAQEQHWNRQEQFNQYVLDVLERHNLALNHIEDVFKRNNLFQEEVRDQFKKHGWTK